MPPAPASLAPRTAVKFSLQDVSAAIKTFSPQPVLLAEQPEIRQEESCGLAAEIPVPNTVTGAFSPGVTL